MAALSALDRSRHDEARPEPSRITDASDLRLTKRTAAKRTQKRNTPTKTEKKIMPCPVETDFDSGGHVRFF